MGSRRQKLKVSRTAAKTGMAASLAVLVYTGFKRGRSAMALHTWAGMALLGCTLWHIALYRPGKLPGKKGRAAALPAPDAVRAEKKGR